MSDAAYETLLCISHAHVCRSTTMLTAELGLADARLRVDNTILPRLLPVHEPPTVLEREFVVRLDASRDQRDVLRPMVSFRSQAS